MRALDPDHFTCPPPAHGAMHQQRPGTAPAEGHSSVLVADVSICRPPSAAPAVRSTATRTAEAAAEAAAAAAATVALGAACGSRPGAIPAVHEMYHLDAASLGGFEEAAAAATRALGDLLIHIGGGGAGGGGGGGGGCGGGRGGGGRSGVGSDRAQGTRSSALMGQQGVALLLLGVDGNGGGGEGGGGGAIVEAISDVRDSFRELLVAATALGVVVPCAPEGAGRKTRARKRIAYVFVRE